MARPGLIQRRTCSPLFRIAMTSGAIERAHRIGPFCPNSVRSTVVKFASFSRDLILHIKLKSDMGGVSAGADFSKVTATEKLAATRIARKKLLKFAGALNLPFKLCYNKLHVNGKRFTCDASRDSVSEIQSQGSKLRGSDMTSSQSLDVETSARVTPSTTHA